jgi:hypothetical protein
MCWPAETTRYADLHRGQAGTKVLRHPDCCSPIDDVDETIALKRGGRLEPWAPGSRTMFVRITPAKVTGRRIG